MIEPMGVVGVWFIFGVIMLVIVCRWRPELWDMIKAATPGYGLMQRGALLFICAVLALVWPVLLFGAIKRTMRDAGAKEEHEVRKDNS